MAKQPIDIGVQGNDGTGDSIREAFRKNKVHLESFIEKTKIKYAICFVYSSNEIPTFEFIQEKVEKLIIKLIDHENTTS